jgi:hypothetical protein
MVSLDTTTRWVVMLLVAGGVGMIGGIGAALLEAKAKVAAKPPDTEHWRLNTVTCIIVGGIAAVAVIYFFVPVKEVIVEEGKKPEAFYELIKLVPLSLIIGSAGTYFLQSFQKQIQSAVAARTGLEAEAATLEVAKLTDGISEKTDQQLDGTKDNVQVLLQGQTDLEPEKAGEVAGQVVEMVKEATAQAIQPQVDAVQAVAATVVAPSITADRQRRLKELLRDRPPLVIKKGPGKDPET